MKKNPVIVTGGSGSIGEAAVNFLVNGDIPVIMTCRNLEKGENIRKKILEKRRDAKIKLIKLELDNRDSILKFIATIKEEKIRIGGLLNIAGSMNKHYTETVNGVESVMAVNYMAPYVLTRLSIPYLADNARIVNTVSVMCKYGKITDDFLIPTPKTYSRFKIYSNSKLGLMLFSVVLSEHIPNSCIVCTADPGVVNSDMLRMDSWFDPLTDILFRPFTKTPTQGAVPIINAFSASESGYIFKGEKSYLIPEKYRLHPKRYFLWNHTEEFIKKHLNISI